MTFDPSAQPGAFADRKPINGQELRQLRAQVWGDGSVSAQEANKLLQMNRQVEPSPEWTDFFVEAVCEYMLSQGEPRGYVTEDEACWLLRHVNHEGRVETSAELELIIKLLERAEYAPPSLRRFALGSIEQAVLTGQGATRAGEPSTAPRIDEAEAAMIRRLVFAPAGDGPAKVSASEAELLFRLKDATLGQANSPEWKKLFVQGVANHLMGHAGFARSVPSDDLRAEYEDNGIDTFEAKDWADPEATPVETNLLDQLYDRNRQHDEYEQALLDFLARDTADPF